MIHYEYPMNERVRTLLRLEDLFDRYGAYAASADAHAHHAGLLTLFELCDVAGKPDLKNDLAQELERQRITLVALTAQPGVDPARLHSVLADINAAQEGLNQLAHKAVQQLRDNEWLAAIRQRTAIPGGVCEFDLPAYHHWRHQPAQHRQRALADWVMPLVPVYQAMGVVLRLLRESAESESAQASQGAFQHMLGGKNPLLVRVSLDDDLPCVPEIAANRHMLNIRFLNVDPGMGRGCADLDLAFRIAYCSL